MFVDEINLRLIFVDFSRNIRYEGWEVNEKTQIWSFPNARAGKAASNRFFSTKPVSLGGREVFWEAAKAMLNFRSSRVHMQGASKGDREWFLRTKILVGWSLWRLWPEFWWRMLVCQILAGRGWARRVCRSGVFPSYRERYDFSQQ